MRRARSSRRPGTGSAYLRAADDDAGGTLPRLHARRPPSRRQDRRHGLDLQADVHRARRIECGRRRLPRADDPGHLGAPTRSSPAASVRCRAHTVYARDLVGRHLRDRDGARGGPKRCAYENPATRETKLAPARLPREASPAKVAKDGQHNDDDDDDPEPGRHVILSLGACRLYDEPTRIRNVCGPTLRWERLTGRAPRQSPGSRARRRVGVGRASLWRAAWPARCRGVNRVRSSHAR
jgi:hypothetical protein